ncbi:MAG TPA: pentapeptide repeat-containing protein, partial [Methylomirabilota bacterium]|nr:pentapeptide repeat-containing protein [Methylomirabilota bacterium]
MLWNRILGTASLLVLFPLCLGAASRSAPKFSLDTRTLTPAEKFVLEQVAAGKSANLKSQFSDETNLVLRGAFLEALLTQHATNVHRNGVSIEYATVLDAIDLRNAAVRYEVNLVECRFLAEVNFSKSLFENSLSLASSTFQRPVGFSAMKIGRAATFDRASFGAEVNAAQMEVTGVLSARETHFNSRTGAVDFTSLKVTGDAFFTRATFAGPVTFQYAHLAENWRFDQSAFTNPAALVNFEAVKVGATTSFSEARFAGYVSFKDARFAALDFSKVHWPVTHADHAWLWLNGMTYQRINAGSEKESWQNLHSLVQRTAHKSAYSADIYATLDDYYRRLG